MPTHVKISIAPGIRELPENYFLNNNGNKIGICCFSAKHAVLRSKNKDLLHLAHNQWGDISIRILYCFSELALLISN